MTTSALYLSFPSDYMSDKDLSTAIQHSFNSTLATIESLEFKIRRFWSQIITNEVKNNILLVLKDGAWHHCKAAFKVPKYSI
jgi:hypothetical protein